MPTNSPREGTKIFSCRNPKSITKFSGYICDLFPPVPAEIKLKLSAIFQNVPFYHLEITPESHFPGASFSGSPKPSLLLCVTLSGPGSTGASCPVGRPCQHVSAVKQLQRDLRTATQAPQTGMVRLALCSGTNFKIA